MTNLTSSKLIELESKLINGDNNALECFWTSVQVEGAPLIEKIVGDTDNVLITFLYRQREEIKNVLIYGGVPGYRYDENVMERFLDTDIWFKTYKVRNDVKFKYSFSLNYEFDNDYKKVNENTFTDPLNPNKVILVKNDEDPDDKESINSFVKLEKVIPDYWTVYKKDINRGSLEMHRFSSDKNDTSRRVWVYTPYGYLDNVNSYNVLILTDGFDYLNHLSAQNVLDNLIHEGKIPPTVCILVETSINRYEELTCNESFGKFIVEEIMPWAHDNYNITRYPEGTIIGGVSLGGLEQAILH